MNGTHATFEGRCIGKEPEILSTRDRKSWAFFLLADTDEQGAVG
jgi:hypothetical protein